MPSIRKRDISDSDDDEPLVIKRTKKVNRNLISGSSVKKQEKEVKGYKADRSSKQLLNVRDNATATLDVDTDMSADAQAIFERTQKQKEEIDPNDGLYHGINFYDTKKYRDTIVGKASSGFNRNGPMRAPTNIRSTTRWDYQPDVCKDYKETGFCGFGDSCKFLHDRSDYKAGWQLELEEKNNQLNESDDEKYLVKDSDEEDEDNVPLHCPYCRGEFKNPMIAQCKHYFCSDCASKMYKSNKRKCIVCNQKTIETLSNADFLLKKIEEIEERRNKKCCHSKDNHGDSSDSDL